MRQLRSFIFLLFMFTLIFELSSFAFAKEYKITPEHVYWYIENNYKWEPDWLEIEDVPYISMESLKSIVEMETNWDSTARILNITYYGNKRINSPLTTGGYHSEAQSISEINYPIYINDEITEFEEKPLNVDGKTFVPLIDVMYALNYIPSGGDNNFNWKSDPKFYYDVLNGTTNKDFSVNNFVIIGEYISLCLGCLIVFLIPIISIRLIVRFFNRIDKSAVDNWTTNVHIDTKPGMVYPDERTPKVVQLTTINSDVMAVNLTDVSKVEEITTNNNTLAKWKWTKKKAITLGGIILILLVIIFISIPKKKNSKEIAKLAESVFKVVNEHNGEEIGFGSGILAYDHNTIITNYHVIEGATNLTIFDGEKEYTVDYVKYADKENDIAILHTPEMITHKVLKLNDGKLKETGEKIYTIGNPEGFEKTVSDGIISAIRTSEDKTWYQISAPISHGSSGGALFDEYGRVIGITNAGSEEAQNVNFAIPTLTFKNAEMAAHSLRYIASYNRYGGNEFVNFNCNYLSLKAASYDDKIFVSVGKDNEIVSIDDNGEVTKLNASGDGLNVYKDYLYYVDFDNYNETLKINRININTFEKEELIIMENVLLYNQLFVCDDGLFLTYVEDFGEFTQSFLLKFDWNFYEERRIVDIHTISIMDDGIALALRANQDISAILLDSMSSEYYDPHIRNFSTFVYSNGLSIYNLYGKGFYVYNEYDGNDAVLSGKKLYNLEQYLVEEYENYMQIYDSNSSRIIKIDGIIDWVIEKDGMLFYRIRHGKYNSSTFRLTNATKAEIVKYDFKNNSSTVLYEWSLK